MDDEPAILVKDLYKSFRLPHEQHSGIKQLIVNFFKRKKGFEVQRVLNDVSFEIKKGEFFGIVGRNGSGKSTLLKLLAGIYVPDKGLVQINGSLTPFIELGVGFNPELTGRENVYLNGALLGFSRSEMDGMYSDIVEFAELERFMDQKLKNYSSGMQVRLAFSIAINSKSDVLIFDEVLAVGDERFQKKCIDVFENYRARKQTIILVTHDMNIVKRFCTRAALVDGGVVKEIGSPDNIANTYAALNANEIESLTENENRKRSMNKNIKLKLRTPTMTKYGSEAELEIDWRRGGERIKNVGVAIYRNTGEYVFGANTLIDKVNVKDTAIIYRPILSIGPGNYHYKIGLFGDDDKEIISFIDDGPDFSIQDTNEGWEGIVKLPHTWSSE